MSKNCTQHDLHSGTWNSSTLALYIPLKYWNTAKPTEVLNKTNTLAGTPEYMAPDAWKRHVVIQWYHPSNGKQCREPIRNYFLTNMFHHPSPFNFLFKSQTWSQGCGKVAGLRSPNMAPIFYNSARNFHQGPRQPSCYAFRKKHSSGPKKNERLKQVFGWDMFHLGKFACVKPWF